MLHTTRRVLPPAIAAALVLGMSACGGGGEEPPESRGPAVSENTSSSPSPNTAEQREQKAVEAAKATLTDYYAAVNRVGQRGYKNWADDLVRFWGTVEISNEESLNYQQIVQDKSRQEGVIDVVSMDEVDYTPDAGGKGADTVTVDLCGDISDVTVYKGDKVSPRAKGVSDRFITQFVLQYHPDQEMWAIHSSETGVNPREC